MKNTGDSNTKYISETAYGLIMGILLFFILFIAAFLSYYSINYSYYSSVDYNVPVSLMKDNVPLNLLFFAGICVLTLFLNHLYEKLGKRQRSAGYIFLGICCLLYAATCLIWVKDLPYYPSGDQLNATAAAYYHRNGNFTMLSEGGYLGKYPFQKGLTFLYEILFGLFGDFCYTEAAKLHIIMGVITMIFGYLFVEETSLHRVCKILYCPLVLFCAPYLILTPYAYGDLPSICFCTVLFWSMLRFAKTSLPRYAVLGSLMAAFSLLMRRNTYIVLIAVLIGMALVTYRKKKFLPLLAGILAITVAFGGSKLLDFSYARRSGYESTQGAPMILWIAMGMQETEGIPGIFNDYQSQVLGEANFDNETASKIALEDLRKNLSHFVEDSSYAVWFFKTKLQMQWLEPTFETLISTHSFDEELPVPEWISKIYYGSWHNPLINFADRYQSIVYLGFLFFLPVFWKKRKGNAAGYIPLIAIVGGFLFSIIWEAQCRYTLPYYVFMLLYVPDGICWVIDFVRGRFRQYCSRIQKAKKTPSPDYIPHSDTLALRKKRCDTRLEKTSPSVDVF